MTEDLIMEVEGMTCTGCEKNVEFALASLPGVGSVRADHVAKTVAVSLDSAATGEADIRRTLEDIGYEVVG